MPILARQVDLYPDDLLSEIRARQPGMDWWALYTMSRLDKKLMRWLHQQKFSFYAPLIARRVRSSGRRVRTSYVPLFPGYVFMYGTNEHRYAAYASNCISRHMVVEDADALCDDLRRIRKLIETGAPLTVEARIEPGQLVRVRSGPFAGIEGTVAKRHGVTRLVVAVRFMQQGASVLLEDCDVEPL